MYTHCGNCCAQDIEQLAIVTLSNASSRTAECVQPPKKGSNLHQHCGAQTSNKCCPQMRTQDRQHAHRYAAERCQTFTRTRDTSLWQKGPSQYDCVPTHHELQLQLTVAMSARHICAAPPQFRRNTSVQKNAACSSSFAAADISRVAALPGMQMPHSP